MDEHRRIALEVAGVFAGVWLATGLVSRLGGAFAEYGPVVLAAVFLVTALRMARRHPEGARGMGIDLAGVLAPRPAEDAGSLTELLRTLRAALPSALRELAVAVALAAVLFPPYAMLFAAWNSPAHAFELDWPPAPLDFVMGQLVVVAVPEEALFRGYFQTRLSELFPRTRRLLGAELSVPAWLIQAALFGLVHVFTGGVARLSTAVPGLLFGWLRARRGGIGAAVFLHALSNLCAELLSRGFW